MTRPRASAGLLLAGLLLSALPGGSLGASSDPGPGDITGIDWRLVRMAGSGVPMIDVPVGVDATLRIDGDQAGGSGGCNSWFGAVKIDGDEIVFGRIGSTMMACEEPAMSIEGQYLRSLSEVQRWAIADGRLRLSDGAGAVLLEFASGAATAIEGVDWTAVRLLVGTDLLDVPGDIMVSLRMNGGEASGTAACNHYSGGYRLDGGSLTFGPMAVTEMACPEPRMELERAWLTTLGLVAGQLVVDGRLRLLDGTGTALAILEQAPASLAGGWALTSLGLPEAGVVSSFPAGDAVMVLGEDGSLTGNTGCNLMNGDYTVDGTSIAFGPIATTKMACRDETVSQTESGLLSALDVATSWRIGPDGTLELADDAGNLLAGFTPVPRPA